MESLRQSKTTKSMFVYRRTRLVNAEKEHSWKYDYIEYPMEPNGRIHGCGVNASGGVNEENCHH